MLGGTVKCPICSRPYRWYSHYAGDQSACPRCRRKAGEEMAQYERQPSGHKEVKDA